MTPEEARQVYDELITEARSMNLQKTEEIYTEVHHINPTSLGGTDEKENLVRMLGRKHFEAHWAQSFMWPKGSQQHNHMTTALHFMSFGIHKDEYHIMAVEYEYIRVLNAKVVGALNKGKKRTPEQCEANRIAQRKCQGTPVARERNRQTHLGLKASEEACKKMSIKQKEIQNRPGMSENKSKKLRGYKHSDITREHYREVQNRPEVKAAKVKGAAHHKARSIVCFTSTFEFINEYSTMNEASATQCVGRKYIRLCCQGKQSSANGFIWRYASDCDPITHLPIDMKVEK